LHYCVSSCRACSPTPEAPSDAAPETTSPSAKADSTATGGDDFQLYTKFDFVPGPKVQPYDDPSLRLTIEGHTDSDGEEAANLDLSQRRAESVRKYLMENGKIDGARLEAQGYGESKPIDANTTPEGKANNRRVELAKI
jgi:hypothetical protein